MPFLWGRNYTRAELMERIGDISQVGGVRSYRIDGGPGDGLAIVQLDTGAGLRFTVVPGRALDISGPALIELIVDPEAITPARTLSDLKAGG